MIKQFCIILKDIISGFSDNKINKFLIWIISKLKIEIYGNDKKNFKKGDVLRLNFGYNIGTEINKERFGLVISPNFISRFGKDLIILPISSIKESNYYEKKQDLIYSLEKSKYNFLNNDSYILYDKIRHISKKRIIKKVAKIYISDYNNILGKMLDLYKK